MQTFKSVGKLISVLYRFTQSYLKKKFKKFDLGPGQIPILLSLFKKENVKQIDLAEELQIDKTSMARTISKLEKHGYLQRLTDEQDSRAYIIRLTPKAHDVRTRILPELRKWTLTLLEGFTADEEERFFAYLTRAAENACREIKGETYAESSEFDR